MLGYRQARSRILAGEFSPVYLIYGEEPFLKEDLVSLLKERFLGEGSAFGYEKLERASLQEALCRLEASSLFAPRKMVVLDQPPGLAPPARASRKREGDSGARPEKVDSKDEDWDGLWSFLKSEKDGPEAILVLLPEAVDRRRRWFKVLDKEAPVVECAPIKGGELARWISDQAAQAGKKIEREALELILLEGDNNLWHIYNELQKYITYLGKDQIEITPQVVELLQAIDSPGNIFKLTDSLAAGDGRGAHELLGRLLRHREAPLKIFFMLTRHFRLLLLTRNLLEAGARPGQLAGELKVHPYEAQKLGRQAALYNLRTLEDILLALHDWDLKIKTGRVGPEPALEIIFGRIGGLLSPSAKVVDG